MAKEAIGGDAGRGWRVERDFLGEVHVAASAYYGAQTQRAIGNFPISGIRFPSSFLAALGLIKRCAAETNAALGLLDKQRAPSIIAASTEVEQGLLQQEFPLDIFQTGSGTSTNMNANEVIARRAEELAGEGLKIHANDHVNMGQSSNDVIPTAIHLALARELSASLMPALSLLAGALQEKAQEFQAFVKPGRTHLQDAVPVTLGQEFGGYAAQIEHGIERLKRSLPAVLELPLGGTAVGTGLNTHPRFAEDCIARLSQATGLAFVRARNSFEALSCRDALVEVSGQLKTIACSLIKIANDIRWMSTGPRCGLGEITLPEVQPGSSIMPGKINPVIAESLLMVCAQVIGNDAAITTGALSGNFELNVMMPVMAHNILQSVALLAAGAENFALRCVRGVKANPERLAQLAAANIAVCTVLAPKLGYQQTAKLAREAYLSGRSVRELVLEQRLLPEQELEQLLNPASLTNPHQKF